MQTQHQPFLLANPDDDLLQSTAHLVEASFDIDCRREEVTREYDALAFRQEPAPASDRPRTTTHKLLKNARTIGLDLFLNESTVVIPMGRSDLTEHQRMHHEKIVTFIQALADRFDRVMHKSR